MNDLISRKEAIEAFEDTTFTKNEIRRRLSELPSAQPKIIRCEDCMHNGSFDTDCPIEWNGKEYCSFAERKDDG